MKQKIENHEKKTKHSQMPVLVSEQTLYMSNIVLWNVSSPASASDCGMVYVEQIRMFWMHSLEFFFFFFWVNHLLILA